MRTTAGRRAGEKTYSPGEAVDELARMGLDRDIAIRVVAIARKFGIKAECVPGGVATVRLADSGRFTISGKMEV